MDELHRAADKLFEHTDLLDRLLEADEFDDATVELALATAKRVRSTSTLVVRHLAATRDQLRPKEGAST